MRHKLPTRPLRPPEHPEEMILLSVENPPASWSDAQELELGELVIASAVCASNLFRDIRELLTNLFGGKMSRYEALLSETTERALERLRERLAAEGYHGALGVRFAHPSVVSGGAELIVYGTGFCFTKNARGDEAQGERQSEQ